MHHIDHRRKGNHVEIRTLRRAIVVLSVVTGTLVLSAAPALAHVEVQPATVEAGGLGIFSFSVPNESDTADTVRVDVEFPTKKPILSVSVQPKPGWDIAVEQDDDGPVLRVVWTATAGGLRPGQFDLFTVSAGPFPKKPAKLVFKALQTYSDGEVVRWIEPQPKGAPEPDFPAPVLKVVKAEAGEGHEH
jgi:periplasmic copper chaperone A